ncbi:MAG TPA: carboxypeptidase-like regulatory domain-containing protein [Longimicrobiales bacterium]|nr:carboxypeptidase-like regulatory domain-containing protein [Longimicrobiales bacterium]
MRLPALYEVVQPVALLVAGLLLATPAAAQALRGFVIDRWTGTRVRYAFIRFRAIDGTDVEAVVSDSAGEFSIRLTPGARYQAEVKAAGYVTQSDTVQTFRGPTASVLLRLWPEPFPLEPLRVTVSKGNSSLADNGFYHRRQMGFGYFMTAKEIEQPFPVVMTDALHSVPRMRLMCLRPGLCDLRTVDAASMFFRGMCLPTVVLDGFVLRRGGTGGDLMLDELLNPFNIEAIEVYPSAAGVPAQYMSPCGAVIAWSKK